MAIYSLESISSTYLERLNTSQSLHSYNSSNYRTSAYDSLVGRANSSLNEIKSILNKDSISLNSPSSLEVLSITGLSVIAGAAIYNYRKPIRNKLESFWGQRNTNTNTLPNQDIGITTNHVHNSSPIKFASNTTSININGNQLPIPKELDFPSLHNPLFSNSTPFNFSQSSSTDVYNNNNLSNLRGYTNKEISPIGHYNFLSLASPTNPSELPDVQLPGLKNNVENLFSSNPINVRELTNPKSSSQQLTNITAPISNNIETEVKPITLDPYTNKVSITVYGYQSNAYPNISPYPDTSLTVSEQHASATFKSSTSSIDPSNTVSVPSSQFRRTGVELNVEPPQPVIRQRNLGNIFNFRNNNEIAESLRRAGIGAISEVSFKALDQSQKALSKVAGPIGIGLIGAGAIGTAIGGTNFLSNAYTGIFSLFSGMAGGNKLSGIKDKHGLPVLPSGDVYGGLSRSKTYIEGVQVTDPTEPTYSTANGGFNRSVIASAAVGAIGGYGLLTAMDASSKAVLSNQGMIGNAFESVFESAYRSEGKLVFGRNFSPLLIGALAGGVMESRDSEGNIVAGSLAGATVGSFVGFMTMKEEIGPQFNKKLGVPLIGAVAGLMLAGRSAVEGIAYNKIGDQYNVVYEDTAERIRRGEAQVPYDLYANPYNEEIISAYLERERSFDLSRQYIANPDSYRNIEAYVSRSEIRSDFADKLSVPDYETLANYNLIPGLSTSEDINASTKAVEGLNKGFLSYQMGYIMPMLAVVGVSGFMRSKVGKKLDAKLSQGIDNLIDKTNIFRRGNNVTPSAATSRIEGALEMLSTYDLKVKYQYPGEREIGKSFGPIIRGIATGNQRRIAVGVEHMKRGLGLKLKGEVISTTKSLAIYAPLIIGTKVLSDRIFQDTVRQSEDRYQTNHWQGIRSVFRSSKNKEVNQAINLQKYLLEGKVTRIDNTLLYDSANIGYGFKDFLYGAEDDSVKALLYKTGGNKELLRLLAQKGAYEGIGVSAGSALSPNAVENIESAFNPKEDHLGYALTYPLKILNDAGPFAAIATITNPIIGNISNSIITSLGGSQPFGTGEVSGNAMGNLINASVFGAATFTATGMLTRSRGLAISAGLVVGGLAGIGMPTQIDPYFYGAIKKQGSYLIEGPKGYIRHQALTEPNATTNMLMGIASSAGAGMIAGSAMSILSRNRTVNKAFRSGVMGAVLGVGANIVSSYVQGDGLRPNISTGLGKLLTGDIEFRDKSFSILTGGGYGRGQYQHIHSKVLWTETRGREEVFVSTGNLETVWTTGYGKEKQFNLAIRVGGDQARGLIGQLNLLHEFTKDMKPNTDVSDFRAIAKAMPNFVLGAEGSDSIQHIIKFLNTAEGDVMISAPYMSLSDNPGKIAALVEAVKELEARGQDVTVVGQNPRGIMAGGRPDLSEKIFKELIAAGVDIYSAPVGADNLTHAKFIADSKKLFLTSHNLFSKNSANSVIEVGMILEGSEYAEAAKQAAYRYMINNNFEKVEPEISGILAFVDRLGASKQLAGLSNFIDDSTGSLLMSTKMGASYFYSRALHNNLMRQSGYHNQVITYKDFGIASALYRQAYLAKAASNLKGHNLDNLPSIDYHLPWAIRRYDEELLTQGLGGWFNERIAMPLGLGRIYKDEYGVLPSIGGAIGSVLDRSYLYFTGTNIAGLTSREQNITAGAQGYRESAAKEGSFQQLFTEIPFLAQSAAEATLFYITVGEPLNLLFSEGIKSNMESLISEALNPDIQKFRSRVTSATRSGSLGFGYNLQTPLEARVKLINNIDSSKRGFYESSNFGFSLYHINSTILRRRSEILMNNVMKPFLMSIVNPYKKSHLKSQDAFLGIIEDVIEEMGSPVDLRYTLPTTQSQPISGLLSRVNKAKKTLGKSLSDIEVSQLGIERIMGYKNIKNRVFSQVQDFITSLEPQGGALVTEFAQRFDDPAKYKVDELLEFLDTHKHDNVSLLVRNKEGLIRASTITSDDIRNLESTEFGKQFESIQFDIVNVGRDRASKIAYKVQSLLDEVPLNPLYWSWFNRDKNRADLFSLPHEGVIRVTDREGFVQPHTRMFGDVFSFTDLADMMDDVLFSRTGLSSWIRSTHINTGNYREILESQSSTVPQLKGVANVKRQVDLIRKTLVDRIHSNWSLGVKGIGSWVRNNIERHRLITGSAIPFIGKYKKGGLLSSSRASKAMEYGLYSTEIGEGQRGIRWGSDLDYYRTGMLEGGAIYKEASDEWDKLDDTFKANWMTKGKDKRQWVDDYISKLSDIEFNPLAKTISHVDESVFLTVEKVNEVNRTLAKRMGPGALVEMNNYLRRESLGFFRISYMNNKELSRRLHKLHPGLGTDSIGKVSKGKAGTALLGVLAGSAFLQQLMSNTGGVSLLTQVMASLTTGGGEVSKVLGNDQGELKQGVNYESSRWFSLGGGLGNSVMGVLITNALSLAVASYIGTNTLSVAPTAIGHSYADIRRFYSIDETLTPNKTLVRTRLLVDLDGSGSYVDISNKIKVSELNALQLSSALQEQGVKAARLKYTKVKEGAEIAEQLIDVVMDKKGITWMGGTPTLKGNAFRNTLIAYTVLSTGSTLAQKATAGFLNWNRNNLESLDPYIYGAVGAATLGSLAKGSGRAFGATMVGALVGMGLGVVSNWMGSNIFDLGSKGMKIDNVDTQITAQLSDLSIYLRQSIRDNRASRSELMAALWLNKFVDSKDIMEKEAYGATSKVLAKQVVLPIIQFFMAEKTIGERRNFRGDITDPGTKYINVGIQGPPILGLSFGIHLPFKVYTKGGASPFNLRTGLAVNEEYDLIDLMYDVTAVSSSFYAASKALDLLDFTAKTAVSKTLGRSANNSLKYQLGAIGQTSKFMKGIGNTIDSAMFIPEMAHRLAYSLTAVDWQLANEVGNSKLINTSASQMSRFSRVATYVAGSSIRAIPAVVVGGILGRIVSSMASNPEGPDYFSSVENGSWMGALGGLAASGTWQAIQIKYNSNTFMDKGKDLINNVLQRSQTGREVSSKFNKIASSINPRAAKGVRRLAGNLVLAATVATLLTDRGFGVSEGMDDSIIHRLGVIAGYSALVGGVIATGMGSLGQDSVEGLVRYAERMHVLDGALNPFETKRFNNISVADTPDQLRVKFYQVFGKDEAAVRTFRPKGLLTRGHIENLEKEANYVIDSLYTHRATVRARYEMEAARIGDPNALLKNKFHHLNEALNVIEGSQKRTAKEILSNDSAGKFLYHMTQSRGAFINTRVSFRTNARRIRKSFILPAFVGAMGFQLSKGLLGDQVINKFFGTLEGKTNNILSSAIRSNKAFTYLGEVAADITRLITFTDSSADSGIYLDRTIRSGDQFGAFEDQVRYSKLRSIGHGPSRSLNNLMTQLNELTVRDDVNTFLSLGSVGFTFRDSDTGTDISPYVQIQGAGSDISTASYMMVSRFFFKSALYGNNDFFHRVIKAMEPISELQRSGISDIELQRKIVRRAALKTLTITASLQPRRKPRKISAVPEGMVRAMGRDSLLSSIMRNRRQMTKNLSYQPPESLVTRLLMSQLTTNHKYIDSMMIAALDPEMASKMGLDNKIIQQLLTGDPFYNLLRNINITNINIFGSDPNRKGGIQVESSRTSADQVFAQYNTPYLDQFEQRPTNLLESPWFDNINRMFDVLPGPLKPVFMLLTGSLITLSIIGFIGDKGLRADKMLELNGDIIEYFGSPWFNNTQRGGKSLWHQSAYPLPGNVKIKDTAVMIKGNYQRFVHPIVSQYDIGTKFRQSLGQIQLELELLAKYGFGEDAIDISKVRGVGGLDNIIDDIKKGTQRGMNLASYWMSENKVRQLRGVMEGRPSTWNLPDRTFQPFEMFDTTGNKFVFSVDPKDSIQQTVEKLTKYSERVNITLQDIDTGIKNGNLIEKNGQIYRKVQKPVLSTVGGVKRNIITTQEIPLGISKGELSSLIPSIDKQLVAFNQQLTLFEDSAINPRALAGALTETFMEEMEVFIDNYYGAIADKSITLQQYQLERIVKTYHGDDAGQKILDRIFRPIDQGGIPFKVNGYGGKYYDLNMMTLMAASSSGGDSTAQIDELLRVSNILENNRKGGYEALYELFSPEQRLLLFGSSEGSEVADKSLVNLMKKKSSLEIRKALETYLNSKSFDIHGVRQMLTNGVVGTADRQMEELALSVVRTLVGKDQGDNSILSSFRHHWGHLGSTPSVGVVGKTRELLGRVVRLNKKQAVAGAVASDEVINAIIDHSIPVASSGRRRGRISLSRQVDANWTEAMMQIADAEADRAGLMGKGMKTTGILWEGLSLLGDTLEGLNIFAAMGRVSRAFSSGNLTEAQKLGVSKEAGAVLLNVGLGVAQLVAIHSLMTYGGAALASIGGAGALALGLGAVGLGLGVAAVGFIGWNLLDKQTKYDIKNGVGNGWSRGWKGLQNMLGRTVYESAHFADKLGTAIGGDFMGRRLSAGLSGAIGGAVGGSLIGIGAMTTSWISAGLTGAAMASAGGLMMAAGVGLVAGAAIGGLAYMIAPETMSKLTTNAIDGLSQVTVGKFPIFALFVNRSGDHFRVQGFTAPIRGVSKASPLMVDTVGDAIKRDYSDFLASASDETGSSIVSKLVSNTIHGGSDWGGENIFQQKYGNIQTIRPKGVSDPLINRTLRIRGKMYVQSIIGEYTWAKILSTSKNTRQIKRAIELHKRELSTISNSEETLTKEIRASLNNSNNKMTALKKNVDPKTIGLIAEYKDHIDEVIKQESVRNKPRIATTKKGNITDTDLQYKKELNLVTSFITISSNFLNDNTVSITNSEDANLLEYISGKQNPNTSLTPETT